MAASKGQIREWVLAGQRLGARRASTHVVIVCDTYSHADFPVYVGPKDSATAVVADYNAKNMHRVVEIYDMALDLEMQLNEQRAWHL